jgi:hypothetical protein
LGKTGIKTALLECIMTTDKPKLMSVKIPMDVLESARIVSAYRGSTMTDLLGDILRPALARLEQEETAKRARGVSGSPKRKAAGK